jgi:hypothetical protein
VLPGDIVFQAPNEVMKIALKNLNSPLFSAVRAAHEIFSCRLGCGLSMKTKFTLLHNFLDSQSPAAKNDFLELLYIFTTPADELRSLNVKQLSVAAAKEFSSRFHPVQWQRIIDAVTAYYILNFLPPNVSLNEFEQEWGRTQ